VVAVEDLFAAANELNDEINILDEIDECLLREFGRESCPVICPIFAALGDTVSHEVLQAMSESFTPLAQFLAVGCLEFLPSSADRVHAAEQPLRSILSRLWKCAAKNSAKSVVLHDQCKRPRLRAERRIGTW
jgi:hypothetical protein